jgi:anaerobic selenocysteine-containing dehydrogenase
MPTTRTHHTTCPLCEATCGLEITTSGEDILSIRGDEQNVLSQGYLCPKAYSLKELHTDPDRLRAPMIRQGDRWLSASWEDAFGEIEQHLPPLLERYGRNALAIYTGNPNAHTLAGNLYSPVIIQSARTQNNYSASTVDQMPKHVSSGLMFGTLLSIPIPDIDHTNYLLLLGANPLVSNGSLMTAPNMRDRLRRLRQRGGKVVVIDPFRSRTAQEADEHHFIRPGTDAQFLFALAHVLFEEGLVNPGRLSDYLNGLDEMRALAQQFPPERVEAICGIPAQTIRRLARDLAAADKAAVYGRIGTCTQEFGTLASWLVDVVNILTGNLDREGGALFPRAAAGGRNTSGTGGQGRGVRLSRWKSRVRGLPEVFGELPVACLAEEIDTPGEGQVKALLTLAGNPVLSTPSSQRLQHALGTLEYMVSVDIYLNETTRYANVILPAPSALERSHFDIAFSQLSIRNTTHYSPPVFERQPGTPDEWEIYLRLAGILAGQGASADLNALDDVVLGTVVQREINTPGSPVEGRSLAEIFTALQTRRGPERLIDFLLRSGPYGDGFDPQREGLSLATLEASPHGVDLGPLQPRIPEVLRTPSGKIELTPAPIVADVARLQTALESARAHVQKDGQLLLVGRRDLRSNNSWMHNLNVLVKGPNRCTLYMHPDDARQASLSTGDIVRVTSRAGCVELPVEVTDAIMPGVVSMPHGWGHDTPGSQTHIAREHAGTNINILTNSAAIDPLSGNASFSGTPVRVEAVYAPENASA